MKTPVRGLRSGVWATLLVTVALAGAPMRYALADEPPEQPVVDQELETPSHEDPNLVAYQQLRAEAEEAEAEEARLHPTGSMPEERVAPRDHVYVDEGLSAQEELPSRYSSYASGYATAVRNQRDSNLCWAFATMAASESSLLRHGLASGSIDLSERHLAYFCNHDGVDPLGNLNGDHSYSIVNGAKIDDLTYMQGMGNSWRSGYTLSSWVGPVGEDVASTNALIDLYAQWWWDGLPKDSFVAQTALSSDLARSRNAYRLKGQLRVPYEETALKQALVEHGALTIQVLSPNAGTGYNATTHAFYHSEAVATTHDVTLVGWDDDYPRENFAPAIPTQGSENILPPDMACPEIVLPGSQTIETGDEESGWIRFTPLTSGYYQLSASGVVADGDEYPSWSLGLYVMAQDGLPYMVGGRPLIPGMGTVTTQYLHAGTTYYLRWWTPLPNEGARVESLDISLEWVEEGLPASDGAWLAKNSWGSEWGEDGLYWISYEDADAMRDDQANLFIYDTTDGANNLYQYDGTSSGAAHSMKSGGSIANVFVAKGNTSGAELIKEVSFWVAEDDVNYSVQVYLDVAEGNDPTAGYPALKTPVTGETTYEGYYTVELPEAIAVREGSRFSAVVTLSHDDGSDVWYNVDATGGYSWVHYESAVSPRQSFAQDKRGAAWKDLVGVTPKDYEKGCCARIKVATSNASASVLPPASTIKLTAQSKNYTSKTVAYSGKVTKAGSKGKVTYSYYRDAACKSFIAPSGVKNVGTYYVCATLAGDGTYGGATSAPVKLTVKQAPNSAKAAKTSVKKVVKLAAAKKAAQKVALPKVTAKFGTAKWKVATKDKKKVLSLKNGKVVVKKGAKKGTYVIKLRATVAATKNYKAAQTKVVTVRVVVK